MVRKRSFICLGVFALICLACFLSPLQENLPQEIIFLWYIFSVVCMYFGSFTTMALRISKKTMKQILPWMCLLICYILRNAYLSHRNYGYFAIGLFSILTVIALTTNYDWHSAGIKIISLTSLVHVAATIFFFFFPAAWNGYSSKVFSNYISGTNGGATGYTAALNGHYSTNGTLTVFCALCTIGYVLCYESKRRKRALLFLAAALIATLLTTKRAHILFFALTFVIIYTLVNWKKGAFTMMLKLIGIVIFSYVAVFILVNYVPALSTVFSRFLTIGQDAQTLTRFTMWEYAYDIFKTHKLVGIGWGGYRYTFATLGMYEGDANAHNIYLQLLAETGIIGLVVFLWIAISSLCSIIKIVMNSRSLDLVERNAAVFSAVFQIFILFYGLTGNPIYDFCFVYYAVAVAMGYGLRKKIDTEINLCTKNESEY